jgi:hypothetical protein
MEKNTAAAIRFYIKQIFCRHSHKTTTRWVTIHEGLNVKFTTKMCNRCGRHFRLDINDM